MFRTESLLYCRFYWYPIRRLIFIGLFLSLSSNYSLVFTFVLSLYINCSLYISIFMQRWQILIMKVQTVLEKRFSKKVLFHSYKIQFLVCWLIAKDSSQKEIQIVQNQVVITDQIKKNGFLRSLGHFLLCYCHNIDSMHTLCSNAYLSNAEVHG
jgi:hypothetical protein